MPVVESTTRLCFGSASTGIGHKGLLQSKETLPEGGDGWRLAKDFSHPKDFYLEPALSVLIICFGVC
jgi:hypothetical protein